MLRLVIPGDNSVASVVGFSMLPIQCCCPLTDASWQLAVLRVVRWAAGQWQLVTTFRDMQLQLWQVGQHTASLELWHCYRVLQTSLPHNLDAACPLCSAGSVPNGNEYGGLCVTLSHNRLCIISSNCRTAFNRAYTTQVLGLPRMDRDINNRNTAPDDLAHSIKLHQEMPSCYTTV